MDSEKILAKQGLYNYVLDSNGLIYVLLAFFAIWSLLYLTDTKNFIFREIGTDVFFNREDAETALKGK